MTARHISRPCPTCGVRRETPANYWWQDHTEISRLLRWLWEEDGLDMANAIYLVEKPWKWDEEYQEMCREQAQPLSVLVGGGLAKAEADADMAEERELVEDLEASLAVQRAVKSGGGR